MTQNEIIRGCKQRHESAYRLLVDTFADLLMGICVRYLRDHQKAEDALQETYILVFRSIHKIDEDSNLQAWVCKIAVNNCLKELRKSKRLRFLEEETVLENIMEMPLAYEKLLAEDILLQLDRLPEHYRIIFNLHIIEGYSHREISEMLGIQESLSRTKLTRARKIMQDIYLLQSKKSVV